MENEDEAMKKYMDAINARAMAGEIDTGDSVGAEAEDAASKNYAMNAQADQAKLTETAAAGNQAAGELQQAGDTAAVGGAAAGNPYVAGAGLALKTVGMVDDAQRQAEQAKIDAYNKKIMAQRSAIRNIFA